MLDSASELDEIEIREKTESKSLSRSSNAHDNKGGEDDLYRS